MQIESLEPFNGGPWVVLDWGVLRGFGYKAKAPDSLVTVLVDVFGREASTASRGHAGLKVANTALAALSAPYPVVIAREWHSFSVDEAAPPAPLEPHQVSDEECTRSVRSSLHAGAPAFLDDASVQPTRDAKDNWQLYVDEMRPALSSAESIAGVRRATQNILEEPHELIELLARELPDQIDLAWKEAIAKHPSGYPKFLFFGAILFYLSEFVSKGRERVDAMENDFDDIHYLVLAAVTGHLCTAEKSAGEGVAHLPDAVRHLFGDRVRVWTPDQWQAGA